MSLDLPYDPENIFAKIIAGDIPCAKVYEDEATLSFMDAFPQVRGHCLVIPKAAGATNLLTATPQMLSALISTTQKVAQAVKTALSPDGIRLAQFSGAAAGQTVFHLHFHILPMTEGGVTAEHGSGQADMADLLTLATQIKSAL